MGFLDHRIETNLTMGVLLLRLYFHDLTKWGCVEKVNMKNADADQKQKSSILLSQLVEILINLANLHFLYHTQYLFKQSGGGNSRALVSTIFMATWDFHMYLPARTGLTSFKWIGKFDVLVQGRRRKETFEQAKYGQV